MPDYPTDPGEYLVLYGYTSDLATDLWLLNKQGQWYRSEDGELCDPFAANAVGFKRVPETLEELMDTACKIAFAEMCLAWDAVKDFTSVVDDYDACYRRFMDNDPSPQLLADMQALVAHMTATASASSNHKD